MQLGFLRRGSRKANDNYTGPRNTFSLDTDGSTLRLHDGVTSGGKVVSGLPLPPKGPPGTFYALRGDKWVPVNVQEVISAGPGPDEVIAGSAQEGYYGAVDSNDFYSGDELALAVGMSSGSSINATTPWLKFVTAGKILFIPQRPIRNNISWDSLYSHGLVYGEQGVGTTPIRGGTDQLVIVSKNATRYKVRALRGADLDPTDYPRDSYSIPGGDQSSEWARLIKRVHQDDGSWANFTLAELGIGWNFPGAHTLCQETFSVDDKQRVFRGIQNGSIDYIGAAGDRTVDFLFGWRPVLEVIPD